MTHAEQKRMIREVKDFEWKLTRDETDDFRMMVKRDKDDEDLDELAMKRLAALHDRYVTFRKAAAMKAAFVTKYGGPEVLEFRQAPEPIPGSHQVLVRVRAIGLNFADIFGRLGVYPGTPKPPFIPGPRILGRCRGIRFGRARLRGRPAGHGVQPAREATPSTSW